MSILFPVFKVLECGSENTYFGDKLVVLIILCQASLCQNDM